MKRIACTIRTTRTVSVHVVTSARYNAAKIKERMPDAPVDSLRMVYDPRWSPVQGLRRVSAGRGFGSRRLGARLPRKDPKSNSPEDLKAAEGVLLSIRPYLRYVHSSRYIDDLANGNLPGAGLVG